MVTMNVDVRTLRHRSGLTQTQFWGLVGVTQSGGSRYETGRTMPRPVRELVRVVHVERIDLSKVSRTDFEVIAHLKRTDRALYKQLSEAARQVDRRKH